MLEMLAITWNGIFTSNDIFYTNRMSNILMYVNCFCLVLMRCLLLGKYHFHLWVRTLYEFCLLQKMAFWLDSRGPYVPNSPGRESWRIPLGRTRRSSWGGGWCWCKRKKRRLNKRNIKDFFALKTLNTVTITVRACVCIYMQNCFLIKTDYYSGLIVEKVVRLKNFCKA